MTVRAATCPQPGSTGCCSRSSHPVSPSPALHFQEADTRAKETPADRAKRWMCAQWPYLLTDWPRTAFHNAVH